MYNQVFKEVMREYDKDRQIAKTLKDSRIKKVYAQIPEIKEIDEKLLNIGVEISKSILVQAVDREALLTELEIKTTSLQNEKGYLLSLHKYPKNYLSNVYRCELCEDTGYIENQKCNCLRQKLIDKYYNLSNLKNILKKENFENFDFRLYSDEEDPETKISPKENIQIIYATALNFIRDFGTTFTNLLFYGNAGLGKTFLCNCIAKDILDKGWPVLYVPVSQLFKIIEQERFHRDEMSNPNEELNMFYSVDLLIIDDLGTEFSTIVTQSELFNIINSRLLNKKPTIISTNLSPKDFEHQYSDRIVSRFAGNYKLMKFIGEDIRSDKAYTIDK